eukprot:g9748.t1
MQVWDVYGKCTTIIGPKLVYLWRSNIRFCSRHSAGVNEYLEIKNRDGTQQNLPGPVSLFFDHVKHESIKTEKALPVAANEAIVVYNEVLAKAADVEAKSTISKEKVAFGTSYAHKNNQKSGSTIGRKILCGPLMYIPHVTERVMQHVWHGESKADHPSEVRVLAGLRRLQKIPLLEQQLYYNVRDVKTSDNNSLTIKLMLCYRITDLVEMLDTTNDPVGDVDFKFTKALQRAEREREKSAAESQHKAKLEEMWHQQKLKQMREMNELEALKLQGLKASGVDLTKYLVAKATGPANAHLHVSGSNSEKAQIHVHQ